MSKILGQVLTPGQTSVPVRTFHPEILVSNRTQNHEEKMNERSPESRELSPGTPVSFQMQGMLSG